MIEILTAFVGLVTGPQLVSLRVEEPVARVEIRVDDELLGTLTEPPWAFRLQLGEEVQVVAIEAMGFDAEGLALESDRQWINIRWPETDQTAPVSPLVVSLTEKRTDLPEPSEMRSWFSSAGETLRLAQEAPGASEPSPGEIAVVLDPLVPPWFGHLLELFPEKYFHSTGSNQTVLDQLEPELRLSLVGRTSFLADLQRLMQGEPGDPANAFRTVPDFWRMFEELGGVPEGTRIRWVSPRAAGDSSTAFERSVSTQIHGADGLGLLRLARTARTKDFPLRIADAVATMGMELAATGKPRALILLRGGSPDGGSRLGVSEVRRYLEVLGVPLLVWDVRPELPRGGWPVPRMVGFALPPSGEGVDFGRAEPAYTTLSEASRELRALLESQRVVWLEGAVLPGTVELATEARGLELLSGATLSDPHPEEGR